MGSFDEIDRSKLQPKAIVTDLDVLVDGLDALLVGSLGQLRPLFGGHRLGATEEEEASSGLLAVASDLERARRFAELVDSNIHRNSFVRDRLAREGARPQLQRAKDAIDRPLLLKRLANRLPVLRADELPEATCPVVAPTLDPRHITRVRCLPCCQGRLSVDGRGQSLERSEGPN